MAVDALPKASPVVWSPESRLQRMGESGTGFDLQQLSEKRPLSAAPHTLHYHPAACMETQGRNSATPVLMDELLSWGLESQISPWPHPECRPRKKAAPVTRSPVYRRGLFALISSN
ncbi:hypothetical protein SKAU_G00309560 [Synaphobranchus kaupii]|uniref:Uncharacterized protein n=1 Tax=Synaphobranchus kaupii TaxID=118154 RepID=A0A9Q1ERI7_SYNKA|nr:hypothetical protein SKAU_G00309560 [Synaphobranchus kaupii]